MSTARRVPERIKGLVTDEEAVILVDTGRRIFRPGEARCIFGSGDARIYVASHEIEVVAAGRCRVRTSGPCRGYDRSELVAYRGAEAHAHMECKFIARPGSIVYMYDSATGWALSGSTIVIDPSARNEPRLCGHKVRIIDQRRSATRPVFVI